MCIVGLHRTPWKISGTIAFNSVILMLHCAKKIVFSEKSFFTAIFACILVSFASYSWEDKLSFDTSRCCFLLFWFVLWGVHLDDVFWFFYCRSVSGLYIAIVSLSTIIVKLSKRKGRVGEKALVSTLQNDRLLFIANSSFYHLMLVFSRLNLQLVFVWLYLYYVHFMEPPLRKRVDQPYIH